MKVLKKNPFFPPPNSKIATKFSFNIFNFYSSKQLSIRLFLFAAAIHAQSCEATCRLFLLDFLLFFVEFSVFGDDWGGEAFRAYAGFSGVEAGGAVAGVAVLLFWLGVWFRLGVGGFFLEGVFSDLLGLFCEAEDGFDGLGAF